jgi:FkbM family methyltransferase
MRLADIVPDWARQMGRRMLRSVRSAAGRDCKRSWAQCGEDLIAAFALGSLGIRIPSYLDIGAHHPTYLNNTYAFYLAGARGVNVEADPTLIEAFKRQRPADLTLNMGIGPQSGTMDFYVMSVPSLNTFSGADAERYASHEGVKIERVIPLQVRRFDEVVDRYLGSSPDFVSLDVEGWDLPILQSIDFDRYRPHVLCVETLTYSTTGQGRHIREIDELLIGRGYLKYADTHINTLYVSEASWRRASKR